MQVATGLHRLLGPVPHGVNAYLWLPEDRGGPVLFDCGWPWSGRWLVEGLRALGCPPERLSAIIITHDDVDHTGRLASLQAASHAPIYAHPAEMPRLEHDAWRPTPGSDRRPDFVGLAERILYARYRHRPVRGVLPVEDGEATPGGWIAYHTPGHTPGHTSYYHPALGVLIAGDALGPTGSGGLRAPQPAYSEDLDATRASIQKLAGLRPEVICCGHGPVIHNGATALDHLARRCE
jgi:glyoxylase-like metal-dependent hydrolase (beta-lactamase superfamily II)